MYKSLQQRYKYSLVLRADMRCVKRKLKGLSSKSDISGLPYMKADLKTRLDIKATTLNMYK